MILGKSGSYYSMYNLIPICTNMFFVSELVKELTKDKEVLTDFMGHAIYSKYEASFAGVTGLPHRDVSKHVVCMMDDGQIRVLDSTDSTHCDLAESILDRIDDFIGWSEVPSSEVANKFAKHIYNIGLKELGKHVKLQPTTVIDYSSAEKEAITKKLFDDAEREKATKDAQSSLMNAIACSQMEDNKKSGVRSMESALKAANASGSGAGTNSTGAAPDMYDMGKCKLNFGTDGAATENKGQQWDVSAVFPHCSGKYGIAVVVIKTFNTSNLWHLDTKYLNLFNEHFIKYELEAKGKDVPLFMETLIDMPTVDHSHPNKFKTQRNSTYTVNKPKFLVMVPLNAFKLDMYVNQAFKAMGSNFRSDTTPPCGVTYADWLVMHKTAAYEKSIGISGSSMKTLTHEKFAKSMTSKLVGVFSKVSPNYNVPLDTWMTHGHIKQFLTMSCGYSGWDEIPRIPSHDLRDKVLKKYPRGGGFPDWNDLEIPDF